MQQKCFVIGLTRHYELEVDSYKGGLEANFPAQPFIHLNRPKITGLLNSGVTYNLDISNAHALVPNSMYPEWFGKYQGGEIVVIYFSDWLCSYASLRKKDICNRVILGRLARYAKASSMD